MIEPYDAEAIRRLKDQVDGDLYVSGSGRLMRAMLADGLVDELHLFVYPRTRGSGPRLFTEDASPGKLSLAACESYENGVVYLAYRPQVRALHREATTANETSRRAAPGGRERRCRPGGPGAAGGDISVGELDTSQPRRYATRPRRNRSEALHPLPIPLRVNPARRRCSPLRWRRQQRMSLYGAPWSQTMAISDKRWRRS